MSNMHDACKPHGMPCALTGFFYAFSSPAKIKKWVSSSDKFLHTLTRLPEVEGDAWHLALTSHESRVTSHESEVGYDMLVVAQTAERRISRSKGEAMELTPRTPLSLWSHMTHWLDWRTQSVQIGSCRLISGIGMTWKKMPFRPQRRRVEESDRL